MKDRCPLFQVHFAGPKCKYCMSSSTSLYCNGIVTVHLIQYQKKVISTHLNFFMTPFFQPDTDSTGHAHAFVVAGCVFSFYPWSQEITIKEKFLNDACIEAFPTLETR